MTDQEKKTLEQKLWRIVSDHLRGTMGADRFKDYILGFIFYKYLSDRMHAFANKVLKSADIDYLEIKHDSVHVTDKGEVQGMTFLDAIREVARNDIGYFLRPDQLFSVISSRGRHGDFILDEVKAVLTSIEQSTMGSEAEDDFIHLFSGLDLTSPDLGRTEDAKNALVSSILSRLDEIDFGVDDVEGDILGDAYEYLIGKFAAGAGQSAGEFYTPQQVSRILARIVSSGRDKLKSVYDPTCGSGSLLLRVAREVKKVDRFYGQEKNTTTFNLARMNMLLHGINYRNFDIQNEDTLKSPKHEGNTFDAIVATPPFSIPWSSHESFLQDDRFAQYGRLAPKSRADYAFICHMLSHLAENGTMAVVLPHGVLFRGGAEGVIREYIIREKNWLDAVIGLPADIFYGAAIPTCLMVFKKCRTDEDVLFVDASQCFERGQAKNALRDDHVEKIVDTWERREEIDRFSRRVSLREIKENGYNHHGTRRLRIELNQMAQKHGFFATTHGCHWLTLPEAPGMFGQ